MDDLQQQLIYDHHRIARVLRVIKQELDKCNGYTLDGVDTCKVVMGLDYLGNYPDRFHHPFEEKIIDCIQEKTSIDGIEVIRAQHGYLEQETTSLLENGSPP